MRAPRVPPALACLAVAVPAVAWAGSADGTDVALMVVGLGMVGISALMLLALFVSLLVSRRSLTTPAYWVAGVDLLAAGLMLAGGHPLTAALTGIAGVLLLFFAVLVNVGESLVAQPEAPEAQGRAESRSKSAAE
jgi:hypothetical protein